MALNTVIVEGRLVRDPELKSTSSGKNVCSFSIAVGRRGKDAETDFFDCTAWEGTGETIAKYMKKGRPIAILGRLRQDVWEKDGKKNSKVSIVVNDFSFLGGASEKNEKQDTTSPQDEEQDNIPMPSEIPF